MKRKAKVILREIRKPRIPVPPVGGTMKDKSKYNRTTKHKKGYDND